MLLRNPTCSYVPDAFLTYKSKRSPSCTLTAWYLLLSSFHLCFATKAYRSEVNIRYLMFPTDIEEKVRDNMNSACQH